MTLVLQERFNNFKRMLDQHNIILTFSGPFSQEIIEVLGEAIKKHIISDDTIKSSIFSVFSVFIEQTQNINNYLSSKRFEKESREFLNSGLIIIGAKNGHYIVYSGNMIEKNDAQELISRLEKVNRMDKDQLKEAYKSSIKKARKEGKDGSESTGLGLLEIARKSSGVIEYSLSSKNERFDYINMQVVI
jgi:hypothetical protein